MKSTPTPWGQSQGIQFCDPQRLIAKVHTAGHGGYRVHVDLSMPEPLASIGQIEPSLGPFRWFEEDDAWAAVVIAFPQWFAPGLDASAQDTLRDCFPQAYEAHYGVKLTPAQSRTLATLEWEEKTKDNFTLVTGYSDRHWDVPEGKVYAIGFRRSDEATRGFLLSRDDYEAVIKSRAVLDAYPKWEPSRSLPMMKPALEVVA